VAIIDADTILDRHALTRAITTLLEDPTTVAIGANVGIVNGCRVRDGRVEEISLPRNWWARFQIVEYMRSFFLFRLACASCNGVVIISGAFGLFRRDAVIAVGGYDTTAVGEDMDLTVRLQRHFRELGQRFRIAFDPNPLAWTQAPEDWRSLRSQRYRWRRGLLQVLWRNRHMIGNPRYGVIGMAVLPYAALFEGLAPLLELAGYVVLILGAVSGTLTPHVSLVAFAVSVLAGTGITFAAVVLSDLGTRRYMRGRELLLLIVVVFVENCGYRQLNSWWGCVGTYQTLTGKGGWGEMKRKAFEGA
jgi:cellulose synthase/poly-beta-1,6-N-acetylglucosamine synthase-like glycosyltransferase